MGKIEELLNEFVSLQEGHYVVTWEIDVFDAPTAQDAAREAQMSQRNPFSHATVFAVTRGNGDTVRVDMEEVDDRDPAGQLSVILTKCIAELADDPMTAGKFASLMDEFAKRFRALET